MTTRDVLVRLAQHCPPTGPVLCRWCAAPWPEHADGCPVPHAIAKLTGYSGALGALDDGAATLIPATDATQPRAAAGPQDERQED